jgi:hypothetical protein
MRPDRLVMYTTVYPGAEPFLPAWVASLRGQTDRDFDLCIGVDGLPIETLERALGSLRRVAIVPAPAGSRPAQVRGAAIATLLDRYDGVIFVDVDDELLPSRVAAARHLLRTWDVSGCRLRIMDQAGRDLDRIFGPVDGEDPCGYLARWNAFGLSNTAYRTETLRACLPVPEDCVLFDWLLASRAWLMGASLGFDLEPRMRYRQYPGNTADVLGPSTPAGVRLATDLVRTHYSHLLRGITDGAGPRQKALLIAQAAVEQFARWSSESEVALERYVTQLNALPRRYLWWWSVAHPELEHLWKP